MGRLRFLWVTVAHTLLRLLPSPCRTGLITVGRPDRTSPVLLTGNYRLTVLRVLRGLQGFDAYLLVANSRGVNVWCAATGGLLTDHDVVSVLKTSGIEDLVDHRRVILPQLAATGIDGEQLRERSGWEVVWGPVEAAALDRFLAADRRAGREMRTIAFPWPRRAEMAVAWAFPISGLALLLAPLLGASVPLVIALVWLLSLILFLGFPLYARRLRHGAARVGFVLLDFGPFGVLLLLGLLYTAAVVGLLAVTDQLTWRPVVQWTVAGLVVLLILSLDLAGSTPTLKSGLHPDRRLRVALDEESCRGDGVCEEVCPVDVLEVDRERQRVALRRPEQCVQCGACLVQCPFDALYFYSESGEVVSAATVRRFKLNLLGKRREPAAGREARS